MSVSELAEAARLVIDAKFKTIAWAGLDKMVDEIFRVFLRVALCRLLAQKGPIFRRHKLTPRREPFSLRRGQQLSLVGFSFDIANHGERYAMPTEHAADSHKAH